MFCMGKQSQPTSKTDSAHTLNQLMEAGTLQDTGMQSWMRENH